jgi:disease resistance protein RPM1
VVVHDIAVSISRQESYAFIHGEHTSNISTRVGIRHLSCVARRKLNTTMDLSCIRSLTAFSEPLELISLLCSSKFKMLRILDLKDARFEASQRDIKYIGLLLHLKYLHFPRGSVIYALPKSTGNLLGLQTLDIRRSKVSTVPTEITMLHNLCSLRCSKKAGYVYFNTANPMEWFKDAIDYLKCSAFATANLHMALSSCWSYSSGIKLPRGVGNLKELQILEKVDIKRTSRKAIKELGDLTQLRKIVVRARGASKKNCKAFCKAVPKLSSLRSLNVSTKERGEEDEVLDKVVSFTSPLPYLERLKLKGRLQKIPAWVGECEKLVKVELKYCELKELEALAELPNLVQLHLRNSAFNAEKLVFHKDGFPKLRILLMMAHYGMALMEVTFEQSTSPNMETIDIVNCNLTTGIIGINHLPKLKEIYIRRCCLGKQDTLREEVENHTNHPVLQMLEVSEPGENLQS